MDAGSVAIAAIVALGALVFLMLGPGQSLFGIGAKSAKDTFIINNINASGSSSAADYTNIAYLNRSQNFTRIDNFTNFTQASDLNISGILYVGDNRSTFPLNCASNNFLSSLGSNGIFTCTVPVIYNVSYELMYNKTYELMYNVSYELMYNKSYETVWTNVAFLNNSQNWTADQNFTQSVWVGRNFNVTGNTTLGNSSIDYLNISSQLFVGLNRSSFPISCSAGQFLSALANTGLFTCTSDSDAGAADFTNVAYLNNSQNWTANQNFTQSVWIGKNLNVTGNSTLGNASIEYLNISGQLFVGANRSSFPITCSGNQFLSSLGSNGIFTCSTPVIYNASYLTSVDYTNVAFLNNTQNFTAQNTFRDLIILGWFNVTNQSVYTTLNNVTSLGYINATGFNATKPSIFSNINVSGFINVTSWVSAGLINATSFNATGASVFGNVNASGYVNATSFGVFQYVNASSLNVSGTETSYYDNSTYQNATKNVTGTSIGVMQINQSAAGYYPSLVLLFDNETEVSGTAVQWLNFTLPAANGFSRIIIFSQYTLVGTSATAYSWVMEIAVGGTIIHDTNITASAITSDIFRSSSLMEAGTTTTTGKITVKLYPVTAGGATVELQSLQVLGVV